MQLQLKVMSFCEVAFFVSLSNFGFCTPDTHLEGCVFMVYAEKNAVTSYVSADVTQQPLIK